MSFDAGTIWKVTKVNWERLGGDNVEEFVAALILLRNPTGNRITPSQGDRGVDVQVKLHSGSYDFYQIKRFTGPLTNAQKRQVEKSWSSFLAQTATTHQVASWNVVMPYDPTPQNLDWVRSITAPGNIAVNWLGRTQLDSWAAENPRLVDYYFGDGRTRTEQVFSRLLQIQQGLHPTSEEDGDLVLKSLAKASAAIHASLNEIDPFYRYEMQCRHGSLDSLMREMRLGPSKDVAFSSFAQPTGSDTCIITHVIPRCRESVTLRPISFGVTLNAESGTDEHQALCRYYEFGLPPQAIKGTVSGYNGPPGGPPDGEGVVSLFETDFQDDTLPLLEVNVRTTGADPLSVTVPISDVHRGASPVGRGGYLAFSDVTHAFRMTLLMLSTGGLKGVEIERSSLAGRRPTESVISYRFLAALVRGGTITLQVRNGGLNLVQFELEAQQDRSRVEAVLLMRDYIESLAEIQRHVLTSIEIPDT